MLSSGDPLFRIIQKLISMVANKILNDDLYYSKYLKSWRDSRVNIIGWTVDIIYERPFTKEAIDFNLAYLNKFFEKRPDLFFKIKTSKDFDRSFEENKIGVILNFQNLQQIGRDLSLLEKYKNMGINIMQLTYNAKNLIGTGCTARRDRGLTEFGEKVVKRLNELNVVIDVSHCGERTSLDAISQSREPIMASHSFCKNLYNHDRGKNEQFIEEIGLTGGYIGILAAHGFLTNNPKTRISDWLDHVEHAVEKAGLDHVGIGSDWFGFSIPPPLIEYTNEILSKNGWRKEHNIDFSKRVEGFEEYSKFPNLIEGLESRGYNHREIQKIAGGNFLRIFKKIVG